MEAHFEFTNNKRVPGCRTSFTVFYNVLISNWKAVINQLWHVFVNTRVNLDFFLIFISLQNWTLPQIRSCGMWVVEGFAFRWNHYDSSVFSQIFFTSNYCLKLKKYHFISHKICISKLAFMALYLLWELMHRISLEADWKWSKYFRLNNQVFKEILRKL